MTPTRRRGIRIAAIAAVLCGGALGLPLHASAHALPKSSDPPAGATLAQTPPVVTITFGEEPDPKVSTIRVVDTAQQEWDNRDTAAVPGSPLELRVSVRPLPRGVYTVAWRTLSAIDGHSFAGSFVFGVQVAPPSAPPTTVGASDPNSVSGGAGGIAGRALLFLGVILVLGAAFIGVITGDIAPRVVVQTAVIGWAMSTAGIVGVSWIQTADAGVGLGSLLGTSLGHTVVVRAIPAVWTSIAVGLLILRRNSPQHWVLMGAGLGAAGSMLADVLASHAAAQGAVVLDTLLQWSHIVAVGLWIGGLAVLLMVIRGATSTEKRSAVRRFSLVATIAILVVAATGVTRAVEEINSWNALFTTTFGILVVIKAGLIVVLGALGAINHFRNVPRAATSVRGLRRIGSMELLLATTAILIAAALVNIAPPISSAAVAATPAQLVANGSDFATTVRVQLRVSPGGAGFNQFAVHLSDYDSSASITDAGIELHFQFAGATAIGTATLPLTNAGGGDYTGQGGAMSIDGVWKVTVLVERSARSVEVPLQITTVSTPPHVTVNKAPGQPTLYTIDLTKGRTAQVYLQQIPVGTWHFHVTFIDAAGNELPVVKVTVVETPHDESPTVLATTKLDDLGHFTAVATLPGSGQSRFDVVGVTSSGDTLATYIMIDPGG